MLLSEVMVTINSPSEKTVASQLPIPEWTVPLCPQEDHCTMQVRRSRRGKEGGKQIAEIGLFSVGQAMDGREKSARVW